MTELKSLSTLVTRLTSAVENNDQKEAALLAQWIANGGLESYKPLLLTLLGGVTGRKLTENKVMNALQTTGSVGLAEWVATRQALLPTLMDVTASHEHPKLGIDLMETFQSGVPGRTFRQDIPDWIIDLYPDYLAGLGTTPVQAAGLVQADYDNMTQTIRGLPDSTSAFVAGLIGAGTAYGGTIQNRVAARQGLRTAITNRLTQLGYDVGDSTKPINTDLLDTAADYLAGAGATATMVGNMSLDDLLYFANKAGTAFVEGLKLT